MSTAVWVMGLAKVYPSMLGLCLCPSRKSLRPQSTGLAGPRDRKGSRGF